MQQDITNNVGDFLRFIRRGLWLALLVAVTAAVAAFFASSRVPPRFEATATLNASRNVDGVQRAGPAIPQATPLDAKAYKVAAYNNSVVTQVLQVAGLENVTARDIEAFTKRSRVGTEGGGNWTDVSTLIRLGVTDTSADNAALLANTWAGALQDWDNQRARASYGDTQAVLELQSDELRQAIRTLQVEDAPQDQIDSAIAKLESIENDLLSTRVALSSAVGLLTILNPASPPLEPSAPRPIFNTVLAFLLGLFLSYGVLLLREAIDTRLRDVDDLANLTGLPVLASFPKMPNESRRLPHEATSYLRTNLLFATSDAHPKVILVTSSRESEGKSSVSLSLAESFVRNNYRTLLIDADLRRPTIAGEYRISQQPQSSLESWLRNPYGPNQATSVPINGRYHLFVIPTYQPSAQAAELLSSGFRECLDIWRKEYDVIIVDSAPVLAVADTLTIAPLCTGTVLVANQQKTDRRQVRASVDLLKRIGVRVPGVVATHVSREARQGANYGYGYGYEGDTDVKQTIIPETVTATKTTSKMAKSKR